MLFTLGSEVCDSLLVQSCLESLLMWWTQGRLGNHHLSQSVRTPPWTALTHSHLLMSCVGETLKTRSGIWSSVRPWWGSLVSIPRGKNVPGSRLHSYKTLTYTHHAPEASKRALLCVSRIRIVCNNVSSIRVLAARRSFSFRSRRPLHCLCSLSLSP